MKLLHIYITNKLSIVSSKEIILESNITHTSLGSKYFWSVSLGTALTVNL